MKKYGVFELSYKKDGDFGAKDEKMMMILQHGFNFAKGGKFDSPDCNEIKNELYHQKELLRYERSQMRQADRYAHRFFIHEAKDNGTFAPTKAELKAAIKWSEEHNNIFEERAAKAKELLASM